ncbi:hypothetical protein QC763_115860 [Podospora pseudopauciseta]|uniref:Rhodopsin domain-containing protein n=1 Tax=Podospora pseudopauciseta TaxID=2093780 RepID=A0ABR0I195_9PEZI|nr:hypothetical protein QC763_115860 [Podospora pseudopauciseta]
MYNREKIGVAIAMSMGIFAGITCIVKLTTVKVLEEGDFSYNSLPLVLWGFIEPACTIMAASIPMLRHLFKNFRHSSDLDDSARVGTSLHHSSPNRQPSPMAEQRRRHMDLSDDNRNDRSILALPAQQGPPERSTRTLGGSCEKSDSDQGTTISSITSNKKQDRVMYEMLAKARHKDRV